MNIWPAFPQILAASLSRNFSPPSHTSLQLAAAFGRFVRNIRFSWKSNHTNMWGPNFCCKITEEVTGQHVSQQFYQLTVLSKFPNCNFSLLWRSVWDCPAASGDENRTSGSNMVWYYSSHEWRKFHLNFLCKTAEWKQPQSHYSLEMNRKNLTELPRKRISIDSRCINGNMWIWLRWDCKRDLSSEVGFSLVKYFLLPQIPGWIVLYLQFVFCVAFMANYFFAIWLGIHFTFSFLIFPKGDIKN